MKKKRKPNKKISGAVLDILIGQEGLKKYLPKKTDQGINSFIYTADMVLYYLKEIEKGVKGLRREKVEELMNYAWSETNIEEKDVAVAWHIYKNWGRDDLLKP